jgi:hypothetical protein
VLIPLWPGSHAYTRYELVTAQTDPYVRVYYRIIDDPKFAAVYDNDPALATWLRLLLAADAMYPAPAPLPRGVKRPALARLVDAELIDLMPGDRYRLHGLHGERERRQEQARKAARERWNRAHGNAAADANGMQPQSDSNAAASDLAMHSSPLLSATSNSSPRPSTQPGEEWDESVRDGADAYFQVTGRFPSDRILAWINRLTKLYGDDLFSKLLSKCYLEDANPRDLLGRVEERCKAIYYRQHKDEIRAESRKEELEALADIQRQEAEAWQQCSECGKYRRMHGRDHEFVAQSVAMR